MKFVLFNPYTGRPRHPSDIQSDPQGLLIVEPDAPLLSAVESSTKKLWLWKNFVDGKPEYWAFDNAYPINLENGDPQTLGEPCGYAIFKPSRQGRTDVSEEQVLRAIASAKP